MEFAPQYHSSRGSRDDQVYYPKRISLPDNFLPEHDFDFGILDMRDELLASYPRTPMEIQKHIAEYYGMISHLDHELGKVVDVLVKKGWQIILSSFFSADHGLALGQHGLMGKQNNYECSLRIPLIFAGPGIPQNEIRESYAYLLDVYPTLCDLIGIDIPASVEGISLKPVIEGKEDGKRDTLYFAYADLVRSVKDDRYKLIEYRSPAVLARTQLFDLALDPLEMCNLTGNEDYVEVETRLRAELFRYRDTWQDTLHPRGQEFWSRF